MLTIVSTPEEKVTALRIRREPPQFRPVEVRRVRPVTPRLLRITRDTLRYKMKKFNLR